MSEEEKKKVIRISRILSENNTYIEDAKFIGRYIDEKLEELERLKEGIEYLERSNNRREDEILELRQENADLDNIINELEKELKDMATLKTDKYGNTRKITHIDINWLLLKIKELKGDDNNGNI